MLKEISNQYVQRVNTADPQNVNSLIAELRRLEENKERGAFVRSHSVIQVEDESPGKFFFQIERHQQQKNYDKRTSQR